MNQDHHPLAFHSRLFSETQLGRSTMEKEALAVMEDIECFHGLSSRAKGFDLFTYHDTFIFIFDPLADMPDI